MNEKNNKFDIDTIRSIVEQVLAEKRIPVPKLGFELTPEPAAGRRRRYTRTTLTVDEELWKLVQDECSRSRILPPKLIDSLLWQHFGKPKLSYEHDGDSQLVLLED